MSKEIINEDLQQAVQDAEGKVALYTAGITKANTAIGELEAVAKNLDLDDSGRNALEGAIAQVKHQLAQTGIAEVKEEKKADTVAKGK